MKQRNGWTFRLASKAEIMMLTAQGREARKGGLYSPTEFVPLLRQSSLFFFFSFSLCFFSTTRHCVCQISLKLWLKIFRHRMHPRYFPGNSTCWETYDVLILVLYLGALFALKYINSLIAKLSRNTWVAFYRHKTKTTAKKEEEKIELVWPIGKVLGW